MKPNQEVKRWMPMDCHSSTLNSRLLNLNSTEQSGNVYENKQSRSREVEKSRSDRSEIESGRKVPRRPAGQLPDSLLSTLDSQLFRRTNRECL